MQIKDLTPKEIMAVKEKATASVGINNRAYYGSGFNFAIKFAKIIESCSCRCHKCHTPVQPPSLNKRSNYGGDICGELVFCKSCWSTLSHEEKMKMANELKPR